MSAPLRINQPRGYVFPNWCSHISIISAWTSHTWNFFKIHLKMFQRFPLETYQVELETFSSESWKSFKCAIIRIVNTIRKYQTIVLVNMVAGWHEQMLIAKRFNLNSTATMRDLGLCFFYELRFHIKLLSVILPKFL